MFAAMHMPTKYHRAAEPPARLHKIMAERGVASRRRCEQLIAAGRVRVQGKPAQLGAVVRADAHISVDGKPVLVPRRRSTTQMLLLNKRAGEICSRKPSERWPRVFDGLPKPKNGRWIMVGRLDLNTAGLLLFSNDGELAHKLMHPSSNIARVYAVRVAGALTPEHKRALLGGVQLEDGAANFEHIQSSDNSLGFNKWYEVSVLSGRKRMVRRLFESQGLQVSRLIRIAYGPQALGWDLKNQRWRFLTDDEVAALQQAAGLKQNYA